MPYSAHSSKWYIPKLLTLLKTFCKYAARWQDKFKPYMDETILTAYTTLLVACEAFLEVADVIEGGG